jgi:hypothetical protein
VAGTKIARVKRKAATAAKRFNLSPPNFDTSPPNQSAQ